VTLFSPLALHYGGTLVQARVGRLRYYPLFAKMPEDGNHGGHYPHGIRIMAYLELIEATLERELK